MLVRGGEVAVASAQETGAAGKHTVRVEGLDSCLVCECACVGGYVVVWLCVVCGELIMLTTIRCEQLIIIVAIFADDAGGTGNWAFPSQTHPTPSSLALATLSQSQQQPWTSKQLMQPFIRYPLSRCRAFSRHLTTMAQPAMSPFSQAVVAAMRKMYVLDLSLLVTPTAQLSLTSKAIQNPLQTRASTTPDVSVCTPGGPQQLTLI